MTRISEIQYLNINYKKSFNAYWELMKSIEIKVRDEIEYDLMKDTMA